MNAPSSNLRPLFLTPDNKEKAAKVIAFAERPENWYHAGGSSWVPGDRPDFVARIDTYRCVYTHTVSQGKHYRHLSISVPADGKLPHQVAVFTLASFFGFTGGKMVEDAAVEPAEDWLINVNEAEHCIVLAQERSGEG